MFRTAQRTASGVASLAGSLERMTVLVGPEGGLTSEEEPAARTSSVVSLRFEPRVPRTETAALAVLALLLRELRDVYSQIGVGNASRCSGFGV